MSLRLSALLCGLALALAAPTAPAAVVDIEDTSWTLATKVKLGVRPLGKIQEVRALDLDVFSFDFEMPGTGLTGVQEETGKTLKLYLDEAELVDFLTAEVEALAAASPQEVVVGALTLLKSNGVLAPRPRGTELALAMRVSALAQVELTIDGEALTTKVKLSMKGSDTQDYDLVDTDWEAEIKSRANVAGVGGFSELGDFELGFAETELDLYESLGGVMLGEWYVDADGDLQVLFDDEEHMNFVGEVVDEVAGEHFAVLDVDEIVIDKTKQLFKVKAGVSIRFLVSYQFRVIGQLEGEPVEAKGKFSSKGVALLD